MSQTKNAVVKVKRRLVQTSAQARDANALCTALDDIDGSTLHGVRDYVLLVVGMSTGRCVDELADLRWRDVQVSSQTVMLTWMHTKDDKRLHNTLLAKVGALFIQYLHVIYGTQLDCLVPDAPIWISTSRRNWGTAISTSAIVNICQRRLGTWKIHTLRHTFAHMMTKLSSTEGDVQESLGCSDSATPQHYLKMLQSLDNLHANTHVGAAEVCKEWFRYVPSCDELRVVWQQLAERNMWRLVKNEQVFLDQVVIEYDQQTSSQFFERNARLAIYRTYSLLLYRGIQRRHNGAAAEVGSLLFRTALARGYSTSQAYDITQETFVRILEKFSQVRVPQSFHFWILHIFDRVMKDSQYRTRYEIIWNSEIENTLTEVPDPIDLADGIERYMVSDLIAAGLRKCLTNEVERIVLLRYALLGDYSSCIAHDLQIPIHRVHVAKFRACQRLRQDEEFKQLLQSLMDDIVSEF